MNDHIFCSVDTWMFVEAGDVRDNDFFLSPLYIFTVDYFASERKRKHRYQGVLRSANNQYLCQRMSGTSNSPCLYLW
ncbi:hypothetical protein BgiBS90_022639 [Biomphalaria glabrata]|nr:hypothetical protein BgiBS90_022639 [Biomphalaria glabrata]